MLVGSSCFVCQVVLECRKNYCKNFDRGNGSVTSIGQSVKSWLDDLDVRTEPVCSLAYHLMWSAVQCRSASATFYAPRGRITRCFTRCIPCRIFTSVDSKALDPQQLFATWTNSLDQGLDFSSRLFVAWTGWVDLLQRFRFSKAPDWKDKPDKPSTACGGCFDAHNEVTSDMVDDLHTVNPESTRWNGFPASRIRNRIAVIILLRLHQIQFALWCADSMLFFKPKTLRERLWTPFSGIWLLCRTYNQTVYCVHGCSRQAWQQLPGSWPDLGIAIGFWSLDMFDVSDHVWTCFARLFPSRFILVPAFQSSARPSGPSVQMAQPCSAQANLRSSANAINIHQVSSQGLLITWAKSRYMGTEECPAQDHRTSLSLQSHLHQTAPGCMMQHDTARPFLCTDSISCFDYLWIYQPFSELACPIKYFTKRHKTCGKMRQECGKLRQVAGLLPRDLQSYRACDSAGSIFQAASDDFSKCCACKPNTLQTKAFSAVCQLYIRSNKVGRKQQIAFRSHTCHHLIFGL